MTRFDGLTNEEKIALTTEQVEYYAKLECAHRGIIIPQKPINELKEVLKPSQKFYQVGYESFVFETEQDAQDYIDAKSKSLQIKSIGNSYDAKNQYVSERSSDSKDIKTITLYSKEEGVTLKDILQYNSETSKEWSDYEKALADFKGIASDFWDEINEILFRNSRTAFYSKIYNDYLSLANGDLVIAFNFFEKAYRDANLTEVDREIVDEILNQPIVLENEEAN